MGPCLFLWLWSCPEEGNRRAMQYYSTPLCECHPVPVPALGYHQLSSQAVLAGWPVLWRVRKMQTESSAACPTGCPLLQWGRLCLESGILSNCALLCLNFLTKRQNPVINVYAIVLCRWCLCGTCQETRLSWPKLCTQCLISIFSLIFKSEISVGNVAKKEKVDILIASRSYFIMIELLIYL